MPSTWIGLLLLWLLVFVIYDQCIHSVPKFPTIPPFVVALI
jgi:hypothetical protein